MSKCPMCGANFDGTSGCSVLSCPSNRKEDWINHYAGWLGITLSADTIELLVRQRQMSDPSDLYTLTLDKVGAVKPIITKAGWRAISLAIETSKSSPLGDILYAIGLPSVTKDECSNLGRVYSSVWDVFAAPVRDLAKIVRQESAEDVQTFFQRADIVDFLVNLDAMGVGAAPNTPAGIASLTGKRVCFTGRLNSMARHEAWGLLERAGGIADERLTSMTDILVTGERVGSVKTKAAAKYGTRTMTENDFLSLVGLSPNARIRR